MPVMRTYQCPDCEGTFDHLHLRSTDEPPNFCPLCGSNMSDPEPQVGRINLGTSVGKSGDQVYRAMEDGSATRAQIAADHLGIDASEMSAMKITDIKDNMREGDTAAVTSNNAVSQMMTQTQGVTGLQDASAASQFAASAHTGAYAHAGDKARQSLVTAHQKRAHEIVKAGEMGRYG